jgi:sugar lactone lactonase YvrE
MSRIFLGAYLLVLSLSVPVVSQNLLNRPESAVYDAVRNRYLVSNYGDGRIIAIDETGTQSVFALGKSSSAGLHIVGDTVYVGCGDQGVVGYNLETGALVMDVTIPGSVLLNDIDSDTSGNIYVSDPYGNKVYKINLADRTYSTLLDPITWPNGVLFDRQSNRLLVCTSTTHYLYSVNTGDGSYYPLTYVGEGHLDGLTRDNAGNIYVSAQGPDAVYRYESTFTEPKKLVSKGHAAPADIFYDRQNEILVVPNISGNRVDFIDFSQPDFFLVGRVLAETVGDGDGYADPGETLDLSVIAFNHGQDAVNVSGELRCDDPYIDLLEVTSDFGPDPAFLEESVSLEPFRLSVEPTCPVPHLALLEMDILIDGTFAVTDTCLLPIGVVWDIEDDLENGTIGWSHRPLTKPYVDEWHLESHRTHSGTSSWKVGGAGAEPYANYSDGALITAPFRLPPQATLSFWHWIDAETASSSFAWDAGVVMIMSDYDPEWKEISPVGGYPYRVASNVTSPFVSDRGCFSGTHDWSLAEFDLSAYSGIVQLMFRFGADGNTTGEGWYVDDLSVVGHSCCSGRVGDANGDGEYPDEVTLGDIMLMVDVKFVSGDCSKLPCLLEADVNQDGGIDPNCQDNVTPGDIMTLVDFLFISNTPLEGCL